MKRLVFPAAAFFQLACVLVLPLPACAASEPSMTSSHTVSTYSDSMHTERDNQQLRLHSSDRGVVVDLAQPSPLIGLASGDVIQSVDAVRVNRVQALTDAVRKRKADSVVLTVQRNNHTRLVHMSAQECADWITSQPEPPPIPADE
jgi:PDZ domain-containing secreted protein